MPPLRALLARSNVFVTVAVEKLMTYATGRAVTPYDMAAVRNVAREAERNNDRLSSLVVGVVKSVPFQMRTKEAAAAKTAGAVYDRPPVLESTQNARSAERERDSVKPEPKTAPTVEAR